MSPEAPVVSPPPPAAPPAALPSTPEQLAALRAQWQTEWQAQHAAQHTATPTKLETEIVIDPARALRAAQERIATLEAEARERAAEIGAAKRDAAIAAERARLLGAVGQSFWPEAVADQLSRALCYDDATGRVHVSDAGGGVAYVFDAGGKPRPKTSDDLAREWIANNPDKMRAIGGAGVGALPGAPAPAPGQTPQQLADQAFAAALWQTMLAQGQYRDTAADRAKFDALAAKVPAYTARSPNGGPPHGS